MAKSAYRKEFESFIEKAAKELKDLSDTLIGKSDEFEAQQERLDALKSTLE